MSEGLRLAGFDVTGVDLHPQPRYQSGTFIQADALTFPLEGFSYVHASPPCQSHSSLRHLQKGKVYPCHIDEIRARLQASGALWSIENVPGAPLGSGGFLTMLCGTMFGLQTPDGRAEIRRHRWFELGGFSIALRPACQHGHESLSVCGRGLDSNKAQWEKRRVLTVAGEHAHDPAERHRKRRACSCPTECDCQDFEAGLVSNECPEHNDFPRPSLTCPVHGEQVKTKKKVLTVTGHTPVDNAAQMAGRRAKTMTVTGGTPQRQVLHNQTRETFSIEDARAAMQIPWMTMKGLSQAIPPVYGEFIGRHALEAIRAAAEGR